MTTLNVPSISRKKPAPCHLDCNSFRVFGDAAEERGAYKRPTDLPHSSIQTYDKTLNLPSWYYNSHYEPERNIRDRNKCQVTYLRRNVKTLNHPVCYVPSQQEGDHWWPARVPQLTKPTPSKTKDSTMRADYDWTEEHKAYGNARHTHNVARPALGSVPVNFLPEKDGSQRFYKEKISYEHQYDSRWGKNYPIKSNRHGAYVSQPITAEKAAQLLQDPSKWRVDTMIKEQPRAENSQPSSTLNPGILPGLGERTYRKTDQPNHKRRENFDIAPRSNLNVRIREYIPTICSSAPLSASHLHHRVEHLATNHTTAEQPLALPAVRNEQTTTSTAGC